MGYDHGRFVWHEIITKDAEQAKAFYTELLGWKVEEIDMGEFVYPMLKAGEAPVCGVAPPPMEGVPTHWVSYLSVEDVDAAAKKVVANGGEALMDAMDIPTVGRMQPVKDPSGGAFFLFKSASEDGEAATGPGTFHWNELATDDPEAAVAFYEKTFGYTHETMEMPDGTYFVLKNGDTMRAGVMKNPVPNAPTHWTRYVAVDDCDAAVKRATSSGGKLLGEVMDVPGVGRFAHVQDPGGAALGVIKPVER